jgi:RHS repeat-associated protein
LIEEYRYDALNRRIAKIKPDPEHEDKYIRTDFYYTPDWQIAQTRENDNLDSKDTVATARKYEYVWDIRYVDALVVRDENKNADNDCTDAATGIQGANEGDEHLYYCQDANFNVTAILDGYDGATVERYMYDPYGKPTVLNGVRDSTGTATTEWNTRSTNTFQNAILYCGYFFDDESGLYSVRHRTYHPTLGRWLSRDPCGSAGFRRSGALSPSLKSQISNFGFPGTPHILCLPPK